MDVGCASDELLEILPLLGSSLGCIIWPPCGDRSTLIAEFIPSAVILIPCSFAENREALYRPLSIAEYRISDGDAFLALV
jgi:hypothetical protein